VSLNRVVMIGRLTKDPELKQTTTGKSVVSFSIAVDKRIKPTDGSPTADFFMVKAWGNTAEFVSNYLGKGRLVAVDGRLETRKYTDNDGANREVVEIVADNVQGLDRPREGEQGGAGGTSRTATAVSANQTGSGNQSTTIDEYDPFADE
jgi:single-strand DNA-binding protein